jgi:hypothetical protein
MRTILTLALLSLVSIALCPPRSDIDSRGPVETPWQGVSSTAWPGVSSTAWQGVSATASLPPAATPPPVSIDCSKPGSALDDWYCQTSAPLPVRAPSPTPVPISDKFEIQTWRSCSHGYCEFTPEQAQQILTALETFKQCAPTYYTFGLQYGSWIFPAPPGASQPGTLFDGTDIVRLSVDTFSGPQPESIRRLLVFVIVVHESRHNWQDRQSDWSSIPSIDRERDAYRFTLPIFDLCRAAIPEPDLAAFDHTVTVEVDWSLNPPDTFSSVP